MAEGAVLEVDPFDCVGRSHGTAVVIAMGEGQGVSNFMDSFLEQSLVKEIPILR
jgi:hypothetical protein